MTGWGWLLAAAALIGANGVFVAAEFALVGVRRPAIEELADAGDRRARAVLRELDGFAAALSVARLGITVSSLVLGLLTARAVRGPVLQPLVAALGLAPVTAGILMLLLALIVTALVQTILGELVPKHLALARPVEVARVVVPVTRLLGLPLRPVIRAVEAAAGAVSVHLLRVEVADELEGGHSLDELARIITASGQEGSLTREQTTLLERAVGLGDRRVEEIMVPRPDVVWLPATATLADLKTAAGATGFSRFPIHRGHEDDVLGSVHVRDVLAVPTEDHATTPVTEVVVPLLVVPESGRLRRLLADLRREQRTAALVVDEHGGTAGIVTLEDLLEELVGEIDDEFDDRELLIERLAPGRTAVDGRLRVEHAGEVFGTLLPDGPYETLAGFVLSELGHIPRVGEVVRTDALEITVTGLSGTRITDLLVRELEPPGGAP